MSMIIFMRLSAGTFGTSNVAFQMGLWVGSATSVLSVLGSFLPKLERTRDTTSQFATAPRLVVLAKFCDRARAHWQSVHFEIALTLTKFINVALALCTYLKN
jgi:hypothetical protein